jgi:hypothetical protein
MNAGLIPAYPSLQPQEFLCSQRLNSNRLKNSLIRNLPARPSW